MYFSYSFNKLIEYVWNPATKPNKSPILKWTQIRNSSNKDIQRETDVLKNVQHT